MRKAAAIVIALAAAGSTFAQDIDNDDIPTQCATVCSNVAAVSADCDRAFTRDSDELACMCQAENAEQVVPICAACIEFYDSDRDDNDDEDNDAGEIRRDCGFPSTTYDPSTTYPVMAMTAATSISGASTPNPTNSASDASNSASSRLSALSSSAASATGAAASSISSAISSASGAAQPTNTGNAGATNDGAPAALAAAALLVAAAWL